MNSNQSLSMKKGPFLLLVSAALLMFGYSAVTAQASYRLAGPDKGKVEVTGTSTLHGWKAVAGTFAFSGSDLQLQAGESAIDSFYFSVEVASLDGGRGAAMNKKIRDAFDADANPKIEYRQSEPAGLSTINEDGSFSVLSRGSLSMAGQTHDVELELKGEATETGALKISLVKDMKMSDFEIEPPSAMFGQIVCGDDIKVIVELAYDRVNE